MSEIRTQIEIEATAERVWQVLTDFAAYPQWNSVIRPERGEARPGERLQFHLRLWGTLGLSLRATIRKADPGRELCWKGRLAPGLFGGEHSFSIEPIGQSRVRVVQREVYTGILVPIYMRIMSAWVRRVFEGMNRELKFRAEHVSG